MRQSVLLLASLVLLTVAGCGGGGGGGGDQSGAPSGAQTGQLKVAITDAPAPATFASVHIVVNKVVVVPAGREGASDDDGGLPVVASYPGGKAIEVLDLHFVPDILGTATIPAGSYSQIRLILAPNQPTLNNYVILTDNLNERLPLTTPSGQQSGVKILGNFTVTAGILNTVLIDFDPTTAIVFRGNSGQINLKPTGIRIIQVFSSLSNAGSVTGEIRSPRFGSWSTATITVVPRNQSAAPVTSGRVFSNYSGRGVWKGRFTAFLPPNRSAEVPAAHYKVFLSAYRDRASRVPVFSIYSSPLFTVTTHVDTPVPPDGEVFLVP